MSDLLPFQPRRNPTWGSFDLADVVRETLTSFAQQLEQQNISVDLDVSAGVMVTASRDRYREALLHLLGNAVDAMPRGGQLDVTAWSGPDGVELEIADSGESVNNEATTATFDPEQLRKLNRGGLRLVDAHRIATENGGRLTVANCPQGGVAFTLKVPHTRIRAAA